MSAACFSAAVPEPFQIFGLRLLPLSLGRYRLLKRFEVGFVSDEEVSATLADLVLGVVICSQRVKEFLGWFLGKKFKRDMRRWGTRVYSRQAVWFGRIPFVGRFARRNCPDLVERIRLFRRYVEEAQKIPAYWDESGGGTSGGHWAHSVEVTLRAELGWSEEEINEAPLSKALADYFAWAERQGSIRLMTEEEASQAEENAKVLEKLFGPKSGEEIADSQSPIAKSRESDDVEVVPTEGGGNGS